MVSLCAWFGHQRQMHGHCHRSLNSKSRHFILRANLTLEGGPLTLSQKVKAIDDHNYPRVHQAFLLRLKPSLPADCRPIIVSDPGFKVSWLKQIRILG